ncbi:MAG: hypothetical protein P8X74_11660 [Reinekea sp.]
MACALRRYGVTDSGNTYVSTLTQKNIAPTNLPVTISILTNRDHLCNVGKNALPAVSRQRSIRLFMVCRRVNRRG